MIEKHVFFDIIYTDKAGVMVAIKDRTFVSLKKPARDLGSRSSTDTQLRPKDA